MTMLLLGADRLPGAAHLRARIKGEANVLLTAVALALAPVALMVLAALGYLHGLKLTGRLIESFYLIIIWGLVYRTALRDLELAARRLAYRRAVASGSTRPRRMRKGAKPSKSSPWIWKRSASSPCV
jgi:potassium efflux system protein